MVSAVGRGERKRQRNFVSLNLLYNGGEEYMLYAVLALISAVIAVGSFLEYTRTVPENKLYLVSCIVFVLLTIVLGGLFLSGRVNKNEDIHITE